jgi:hypothetical protein
MHRSSEFHRARQTPCRSVRLPGRTDPAGRPFLRSKTNSETCVTIRIRWQAPLIVGRRPRRRYDLCRKYRECRKILGDDGIACTWLSTRRAKERALSFLSLFRRQCPAAAGAGSIRRINGLPGLPEKRSGRDSVRGSARRLALPAMHTLPRREKSLSCALENAAHPASAPRNFGNRIHCSSA